MSIVAVLFAYAFLKYRLIDIPFFADQVKEWLIAAGLVLLIVRLTRRSWFERTNLIRKLHGFGLWMLAVSTAAVVFPLSENLRPESSRMVQALSVTFFHTVLAFSILAAFLLLLLLLKALVFVQQTRRTEIQFRILLAALFLNIVFVLIAGPEEKIRFSAPFTFDSPNPFHILLILVSVLVGLRNKWIHYLNKKSKLFIFFAGNAAFIFFLTQYASLPRFLGPIGISAETAVSGIAIVTAVYSGMALTAILIHLPSAGLMDRKMREVKSFQELSAVLGADLKKETLVAKIPALANPMVDADIAWLELEENGEFQVAASYRRGNASMDIPPEAMRRRCREEVLGQRKTVLMNDVSKCAKGHSEVPFQGSLLASPVASQAGILGILFAMKSVPFGFVEESQGLFQAFANQAAISLENVHLVEQSIKQQMAEEELRVAHDAQMRLLPQRMPSVRGFDIDGLCVTANEIGGDFYDVIPVRSGRVDMVIGDVSGKGAAAAFYMAEFKGVIQTLVSHFDSPKDILTEMNSFLRKQCDQDMFLTMVYAILHPSRRTLRFARAGHCPVGLIRGRKLSWLEPKGLGLGLVPDRLFRSRLVETRLTLKPEDVLFFYTDGLTEARNPVREEFGEERLARLLAEVQPSTAQSLVRTVAGRVDAFTENEPRHDDITMLALRTLPAKKTKTG